MTQKEFDALEWKYDCMKMSVDGIAAEVRFKAVHEDEFITKYVRQMRALSTRDYQSKNEYYEVGDWQGFIETFDKPLTFYSVKSSIFARNQIDIQEIPEDVFLPMYVHPEISLQPKQNDCLEFSIRFVRNSEGVFKACLGPGEISPNGLPVPVFCRILDKFGEASEILNEAERRGEL